MTILPHDKEFMPNRVEQDRRRWLQNSAPARREVVVFGFTFFGISIKIGF